MHFTSIRSAVPIIGLTVSLMLGGCWGGDTTAAAPRESVSSRFVMGSPDEILTTIVDPLPVKAAVLRRSDGQTIEAHQIDKERNVYTDSADTGPDVGVGVAGGSQGVASSGIGFGFPLFGGGGSGTSTHATTTSMVRFKVPDMEAYRRDWQHWVLHIDLDDGANRRSIETLPPAPPQQ